ncbi:hypothetical protein [Peterkaempfera sp. SMS 1(5)a]|uniref:hypothetical protein n=1 Tax=Peterkaempfera podocarpi TaxID=3232308 RepID=UPI0036722B71
MLVNLLATADEYSPPVGGLILLALFGLAGAVAGSAMAFNIRGAADALEGLRQASAERKAQASMRLITPETPQLGRGFFRLMGGLMACCGAFLLLLGVALLAADA